MWAVNSNNDLNPILNENLRPGRVESSFVPSIEIAQNIPLSQNNSEHGAGANNNFMRQNISPQFAFQAAGQKKHLRNRDNRSANRSVKLDDSIRSPSVKSESVSVHEGDDEP